MKLSYGFLAFNNWPILERTLESAKKLQHKRKNVQWVIVDNSTKEFYWKMQESINAWCKANPTLHVDVLFNSGQNTGEGGGMNQCFDLCAGEYIMFFQDDWECVVDYPFIDLAIETLERFSNIFMVQFKKRPWKPYPAPGKKGDRNNSIGRVLMREMDKQVYEMADNGFGNNTNQVKLLKKSNWERVGRYPDMNSIDFSKYAAGTREGSIGEFEYGLRLNSLGFRAAKINAGQFDHTIPENARSAHFITE